MDLSRTLRNIKLKITKPGDTAIAAADVVGTTNNLLDTFLV
jgi:hypothetical protein